MPETFSDLETTELLQVKGVGPTVLRRLEELGIVSFQQLQDWDANNLIQAISEHMGSTCWRNSPQAQLAIAGVIARARAG